MAKRKKDLYWAFRPLWQVTYSKSDGTDSTQTFVATGHDFADAARNAVQLWKLDKDRSIKSLVLVDEPSGVRTLIDLNAE